MPVALTPGPGGARLHEMPPAYLIVDGHSVIFSWDDLRELHARHPARAREELCTRLRLLHDTGAERVVVVFDGQGKRITADKPTGDDIQVIYSNSRRTADTVIERLTARYAADFRITVVTADRLEQITVSTFGGYFLRPEELLRKLRTREEEIRRSLEKTRSRPLPRRPFPE